MCHLLLLLFCIPTVAACPKGFFSHTIITCNLWDIWMDQPPISQIQISSPAGEFVSHFSPPGSRCELLLSNASTGTGYRISAIHAFIDTESSLRFFPCRSPNDCDPLPAFTWSNVAWNVQRSPTEIRGYDFTTFTKSQYLKIVLQVSRTSSASNTFALRWSTPGCMPCVADGGNDDRWGPFVKRRECETHGEVMA